MIRFCILTRVSTASLQMLLSLALLCSGCASTPQWTSVPRDASPALEQTRAPVFTWKERPSGEVAPGYLIGIKSPDRKVNGEFRIEFDQMLKLPYEVRVNTAGLTETQLSEAIQQSYSSYFRFPSDIQVSVLKKEYLVDAQGLVEKPGQYLTKQESSLDEIIAQAGGLKAGNNPENSARYVKISGPSGSGMIRLSDYYSGHREFTPRWQGGEAVFFQSEAGVLSSSLPFDPTSVHVLGQVKNPSEYTADANADFFTYLTRAGGPTDRADLGNVSLIRVVDNQTRALTFDMLETESIPEVLPGDTIILNSDNATPTEKSSRVGANFASIISALGIVVIAGL